MAYASYGAGQELDFVNDTSAALYDFTGGSGTITSFAFPNGVTGTFDSARTLYSNGVAIPASQFGVNFDIDPGVKAFGMQVSQILGGGVATMYLYGSDDMTVWIDYFEITSTGFWGIVLDEFESDLELMIMFGTGSNAFRISRMYATSDPVPAAIPLPAAAWLLGSGLVGLAALRRKHRSL